jgi:anti-sigma B factor antagonist
MESEVVLPGDMHVELEPLRAEAMMIVRVSGALDRFSGPRLKDMLLRAVDTGTNQLIIDLSGVNSVDSSGLGVLVGTLKRARQVGGDLRLAGASHKLATMLTRMSLDHVLGQDSSVPDTVMYFRERAAVK